MHEGIGAGRNIHILRGGALTGDPEKSEMNREWKMRCWMQAVHVISRSRDSLHKDMRKYEDTNSSRVNSQTDFVR